MALIPTATYRLQFNAQFTFNDARDIAAYLAELGISDLYASPITRARKGSPHGYDVVDATALNPELGTDADFEALQQEMRRRKLGMLLDIVPNHMAASPENAWWMSVLENGQQSRYLHYFDIEWRSSKLLLPILGRPYGEALEAQEICLAFDADGFSFHYYDKRLPLAPQSYRTILAECVESLPKGGVAIELRDLVESDQSVPNSRFLKETLWRIYEQSPEFREALDRTIERFNGEPGKPETFNTLDRLLDAQWYRLAYWRIASEKINYRRFFDVTDLVGVRVENPEVFEARNRRIFDLVAEGKLSGLRIDHIDGLYEPAGYLRKLQLRIAEPNGSSEPFYVVVEKILAKDETLPRDFAVSGTTGYDFLDTLNAVFVDPAGLQRLTRFYRSFTGVHASFEDLCYERKKQVIAELFPGEMRGLGKQLGELSMHDRNARDFAPTELLVALTEITACMHVYRTYAREGVFSEEDRRFVQQAVAEAKRRAPATLDRRLFDFLERVLLVDPPQYVASQREQWLAFVMRWQQFTGRVMAKGVEDTAFYNYHRLISLNEVGGEPGREGDHDPVAELHARNERILADWPDTLNATSTHDTKRSEDVRARINVLSELAETWEREARRWSKLNAPLRPHGIPDANEELLIYQTLVGMWPLDDEELDTVPDRLRQYLEKASREAKTHTSWIAPNADYEKALLDYASAILANGEFCAAFSRLQKRVAFHGYLNALAQLVLKITSPGVPDFYQGTELWDLSLVDPDNRRPVDYERRRATLKKLMHADGRGSLDLSTLQRRWFDGRIKMFVTWRTLAVRARRGETFRRGAYTPLVTASPNVVAFLRGDDVLVAVPRLTTRLVKPPMQPTGEVWGDAALDGIPAARWRNAYTGETLQTGGGATLVADVLRSFPVAVWERA